MANTVISPNMNMPVPVVSEDPGPDWATNIVASLSVVDSHTHTSGQGVAITPAAININADLPLNGNNLITSRSVRFSPQSGAINGASDLGCLYENGVDLYYIDGAGNQVRITQGGSVTGSSGTITGLPSGTASAAYSAGAFTFQSATNTPATMIVGPIVTGSQTVSPKFVTVSASASQPANYNLTWPLSLPAGSAFVTCDVSGNLGTSVLATPASTAFVTIDSSRNLSTTLVSTVTSGSYSPTVTAVSGTAISGQGGSFTYTRVNNQVTVFGAVNGTSDSSGNLQYNLTLPINPTLNFSGFVDAIGGAWPNGGGGLIGSNIISNPGTKTVLVATQIVSGLTAVVETLTFTYNCA